MVGVAGERWMLGREGVGVDRLMRPVIHENGTQVGKSVGRNGSSYW